MKGQTCNCEDYIFEFYVEYNGLSGTEGKSIDHHDNIYATWPQLESGEVYGFDISNANHPGSYNDHNDPELWSFKMENGFLTE